MSRSGSSIAPPACRLAHLIDEGALREQLDHIRSLSLSRGESTWLRGNLFYGKRQMFEPEFIEWLEELRLPPYHLEKKDGQYELTFEGAVARGDALGDPCARRPHGAARPRRPEGHRTVRASGALRPGDDETVGEGPASPAGTPACNIADFGTRRRHSFLWQDWCVQAMMEGLGERVHRHLQLPDRHAARHRGDRHQRARAADGLRRARRLTTRNLR
jgi:nicotinate phosphoribosyltransferase